MAVQYVSDFSFAPSPPRPTIKGYARGGHVKPSTPKTYSQGGTAGCYAKGGKVSPDIKVAATRTEKSSGVQKPAFASGGKVATGKQWMGEKPSRNPDDATSPGSPKRTPMAQSEKNKTAASNKFATEGRGTPPATKQEGNVERMSGYSDFKSGGRIKNLGHYAHGGKVKASRGEVASGKAGSGKVPAPVKATDAGKAEKRAGTPKTAPGSRVEIKSGTAKAAMGGLSRAPSPRKNAAIHAKSHKPHVPKAPKATGLGALAGALGAPPGGAPPMGAPPAPPMGGAPPAAPMGGAPMGGPPAMKSGGGVKHVIVHHVSHK